MKEGRIAWPFTLVLAALAIACTPTRPAPVIVGGWRAADPSDAEVEQAATFAAAQSGAPLDSVLAAATQVVAGTNYALTLRLGDGRRVRVTVWRRLDGGYELARNAAP